jgi:DNA-directed RNA polymerase alpha subunit
MSPGQPGSPMDQQFCADITSIARSLDRIAQVMEARELVDRALQAALPADAEALARAIQSVRKVIGMVDAPKQEVEEQSIDVLDLPIRPYNVLRREGIHTVGQLLRCYKNEGIQGFEDMRNLGFKGTEAILAAIQKWEAEHGDS